MKCVCGICCGIEKFVFVCVEVNLNDVGDDKFCFGLYNNIDEWVNVE